MDPDDPVVFYQPGNILHQEEPFLRMIYLSQRDFFCDYCLRGAADSENPYNFQLTPCKHCNYVTYCRKTCRKSAWSLHKLECSHLKKLPRKRGDFIRLVGLAALAVQGKDWNKITETVLGEVRSFEDLESNCHYTKNNPKLRLYGLEMCQLVKEYLGKAIQYNDDQLIELIGKVKHNRYSIYGKGSALYIGASVFGYACIPTAIHVFRGTQIAIRAFHQIFKGDKSRVLIPYSRMIDMENRFAEAKKTFCGPCLCYECKKPYGESVLTKILDWNKAFDIIECTELALERLEAHWNNGGRELSGECMQALNMLSEVQEKVLGETNILRMRFIFMKAYYEKNERIKLQDLLDLYSFAATAFGNFSEELYYIAQEIAVIFRMSNEKNNGFETFREKMNELFNVLYGVSSEPKTH